MADLMKSFGGGKRGGLMGKAAQMMGMDRGMQMPSPEELAKLAEEAGRSAGGGAPAAAFPRRRPSIFWPRSRAFRGSAAGMLSGLNPFGKKK